MRSPICTRITIAALAACTMAAVAAPAWGQGDDVTLHRDGSKAVPLVADVSEESAADSSSGAILRRDGSKAVPFVADLDPEPAAAADGFDWASAAVGAGAAMALIALAGAAMLTIRRRTAVSPSA